MSTDFEHKIKILSKKKEDRSISEQAEIQPFIENLLYNLKTGYPIKNSTQTVDEFYSYFECVCNSPNHLLKLYYNKKSNSLSFLIFINPFISFWKRLIIGIKYIFNIVSNDVYWNTFNLQDTDIDTLLTILLLQKKRQVPHELQYQLNDYLKLILNEFSQPEYKQIYDLEDFDFSNMTDDDYNRILFNIIIEKPISYIMSINNIYISLCEEFNNEILHKYILEQHK